MRDADSRIWYFAYGSNLSTEQMIRRTGRGCLEFAPEAVHVARRHVEFNMLGESGEVFANLAEAGEGVWGVIYACDEQCLAALDEYEAGYLRMSILVTDRAGRERTAVTYVARSDRVVHPGVPTAEYLGRILTGAREHALPPEYVALLSGVRADRAE